MSADALIVAADRVGGAQGRARASQARFASIAGVATAAAVVLVGLRVNALPIAFGQVIRARADAV